jgi:hypothetical protein
LRKTGEQKRHKAQDDFAQKPVKSRKQINTRQNSIVLLCFLMASISFCVNLLGNNFKENL